MAKELEEELGLLLTDLEELREVKRFDAPSDSGPDPRNHEFRVLYQARLKAASAGRIRLRAGEVAGLAVITLPELHLLVERFPERVASGLVGALPLYQ
jgi:8-oxo-dGTP pyrophosphatase MutT (NUDIX family)